jgi:hypothetical protein
MNLPIKIHGGIKLLGNDSKVDNLDLERLDTDPVEPNPGRLWFNNALKRIKYTDIAPDNPLLIVFKHLLDNDDFDALMASLSNSIATQLLSVNSITDVQAIELTTNSTTPNQIFGLFPISVYRGAEFNIHAVNTTDNLFHSVTIKAIHDSVNVSFVEYGDVSVGSGPCATFNVDIVNGNLRLLATPLSADTTDFRATVILMKL